MSRLTESAAWKALEAHSAELRDVHMRDLFAADPLRFERFSLEAGGLLLDYSKNVLSAQTLDLLLDLAQQEALPSWIERMFTGSRINTNVGDLASSITVVTKQQLDDTGSLNINDVFLYEANTEGAGTYTPYIFNRSQVRDGIGGYSGDDGGTFSIATANRVRGLGSADTAQNNYPTITRMAFDSYNTNSVEINRGPNSMLFGTGSPAGIVNQSSTEAVIGSVKIEG